ncbi:MAG: thioredoxin-disulfide reductase [Dehalococcoidia bacterium]
MAEYQVIIVGGGPAGITAGLYTSRAGFKSLLLERGAFGGQMINTSHVENYPGFVEGISGAELGMIMHQQATKYGLESNTSEVTTINPGPPHTVSTSDGNIEADVVVLAPGSEYRRLGVPGEEEFSGRGVSYCATCDGFFFRNKVVAVVGGGDTAITDALELTQHASMVYVIHRRDQLRASQVLQHRAFNEPKLECVWDSVVEEIVGDNLVQELKLRNIKTNEVSSLQVNGVFVAIGIIPNTQSFAGAVELDSTGAIKTDEAMATSVPGIFAAGDARSDSPRQIATAVGDGATAANSVMKYLQEKGR